MRAGERGRRVQVRRAALVLGPLGQAEVWSNHGPLLWASRTDVSDGERYRAEQVERTLTTRFVLPWSPFTAGLTTRDRLVCERRGYDIVGVKEIGRRRLIEVTAASRSEDDEIVAQAPSAFGDADWSLAVAE